MKEELHNLLKDHIDEDKEEFKGLDKRLHRMEIAIYGLYVAVGLFAFLIEHPTIIKNLSAPMSVAYAVEGK